MEELDFLFTAGFSFSMICLVFALTSFMLVRRLLKPLFVMYHRPLKVSDYLGVDTAANFIRDFDVQDENDKSVLRKGFRNLWLCKLLVLPIILMLLLSFVFLLLGKSIGLP